MPKSSQTGKNHHPFLSFTRRAEKKTRSFPFFLPHTQVFAVHMPCVGSLKKDGPPPPEKIFLLCPVMQRKRHGRAQMPDRQRAEILTRPFPGRSEGAQNMPQKCMFRFSSHSLLPGSEVSQNNGPRRTKGSGCSVCDSRAFSPRPSILAAHCLMYALRIIFHGLPRRRPPQSSDRAPASPDAYPRCRESSIMPKSAWAMRYAFSVSGRTSACMPEAAYAIFSRRRNLRSVR